MWVRVCACLAHISQHNNRVAEKVRVVTHTKVKKVWANKNDPRRISSLEGSSIKFKGTGIPSSSKLVQSL